MKKDKKGFLIPIVALIVAVIAVGAGVGYFKNKEVKTHSVEQTNKFSVEKTKPVESEAKLIPKAVPGWNTFISMDGTFSISYPKNTGPGCGGDGGTEFCDNGDWEYVEGPSRVVFGTKRSRSGGYIWGIFAYNKEGYDVEKGIKVIGSQFDDRQEKREKIEIGGRLATAVTITTADYPDWSSKRVFVEHADKIYIIGGTDSREFKMFYESFRVK